MIKGIKKIFRSFLIKRKFLKGESPKLKFNNFFNSSNSFLLLMPDENSEFNNSLDIPRYLNSIGKDITLFCSIDKASRVESAYKFKTLVYTYEDISKLNFPTPNLLKRIKLKKFDVTIDLSIKNENDFYGIVTKVTNAKYKIGIQKEGVDFYNMIINLNESDVDLFYPKLLNALKMF